jgi:hypothetical protein
MPRTIRNPEFEVSADDALAMLDVTGEGDDRRVHTFRQTGPILLGADWGFDELVEAIKEYGVEESGPGASGMHHGLIMTDDRGEVFIATKPSEGAAR